MSQGVSVVSGGRLYRKVAAHLAQAIRVGDYPVGARLPAERELATEHAVSRPTVREAIIALEVQGLVEVRVGSGVYVCRNTPRGVLDGAGIGAFELTEARLLFESEAAALAATLIDAATLNELEKLVERMQAENESGVGEEPDRLFHSLIARATGNEVIVQTVDALWRLRTASPECALLFQRARSGGSKPVVEEHAAILEALRAADPAAARAAMRFHLGRVIDHLLDATEADEMEKARARMDDQRDRFRRSRVA